MLEGWIGLGLLFSSGGWLRRNVGRSKSILSSHYVESESVSIALRNDRLFIGKEGRELICNFETAGVLEKLIFSFLETSGNHVADPKMDRP